MDSKLASNTQALSISCTDCFKLRRLSSAYSQCGLLEVSQFHANTIKAVQRLHLLQVRAVEESSRRARSSKSESARRARSSSGQQRKQYQSSTGVANRPPAQSSPELIWPILGSGVFVAVIYGMHTHLLALTIKCSGSRGTQWAICGLLVHLIFFLKSSVGYSDTKYSMHALLFLSEVFYWVKSYLVRCSHSSLQIALVCVWCGTIHEAMCQQLHAC